jgi:hypothetical protein
MASARRQPKPHPAQLKAHRESIYLLRAQISGALPPAIDDLPTANIEDLAEALRTARARNSAEIDAAVEKGLGRVPALLRGSVKRIIFR